MHRLHKRFGQMRRNTSSANTRVALAGALAALVGGAGTAYAEVSDADSSGEQDADDRANDARTDASRQASSESAAEPLAWSQEIVSRPNTLPASALSANVALLTAPSFDADHLVFGKDIAPISLTTLVAPSPHVDVGFAFAADLLSASDITLMAMLRLYAFN